MTAVGPPDWPTITFFFINNPSKAIFVFVIPITIMEKDIFYNRLLCAALWIVTVTGTKTDFVIKQLEIW